MTEQHVIYEIKIHRSLKPLLWLFVIGILINAIPDGTLVRNANSPPALKILGNNEEFPANFHDWNPIFFNDSMEMAH